MGIATGHADNIDMLLATIEFDIREMVKKMTLKKCPCGATPKELSITDAGQGGKYAMVSSDCCGEWEIEFRTEYNNIESDECNELAIKAWNNAPREIDEN